MMYISVTSEIDNPKAVIFKPLEIKSVAHFLEIAKKHAYSLSLYKDNHRLGANVISTEALFCDIDNKTGEHCSMEEFKERWKEYKFILLTSRNHRKEKTKSIKEAEKYGAENWPALDRFHVIFPLGYAEKDFKKVKSALVGMIAKFKYFDSNVSDPCRQLYGASNSEIYYNPGKNITIDDFIEKKVEKTIFEDDCPEYLIIDGHGIEIPHETTLESILPDRKTAILEALHRVNSKGLFDNYNEWLHLGAGLKNEGYSFEDWLDLSHSSQRDGKLLYEAKTSWKSFNGEVTGGTLTKYIRDVEPDFMTRDGALKQIATMETVKRETMSKKVTESHKENAEKNELVKSDLNLPMPVEKWDTSPGQFTLDQKGNFKPKGTLQNLEKMLNFYHISVRENLMRHRIEIVFQGKEQKEGKHENAMDGLIENLAVINNLPVGKDRCRGYVASIGHERSYHPVRDYLNSLEWDGVDRFEKIINSLPTKHGFPDKIKALLLKRWFVSCVASAMEKDFHCRGVLVLQGPQSIGKTSWFKNLVPDINWFEEGLSLDTRNKDTIELAMSCWIGELGELEGVFKRSDLASLKSFLTKQVDRVRFAYETRAEDYQRRTVYCGSVNQQVFLTDPTGTSRFWVIPVVDVLSHGKVVDLDQWWAQVKGWYNSGEKWWLSKEEEASLQTLNEAHSEIEVAEELIAMYYDMDCQKTRVMTSTEILYEMGNDRPNRFEINKLAEALKKVTKQGVKKNKSKGFYMPQKKEARDYDPDEISKKEMVVDHVVKQLGDDVPF